MYYSMKSKIKMSHLAYADDTMIFTSAWKPGLVKLMATIAKYEALSGQLVNIDKSSFIVAKSMPLLVIQCIKNVTGFMMKHLPITYLGAPLYTGNKKASLFDSLIQSLNTCINGWEKSVLSFGGRLQLIKSFLLAKPLYLMQVITPPKTIISRQSGCLIASFGARALKLRKCIGPNGTALVSNIRRGTGGAKAIRYSGSLISQAMGMCVFWHDCWVADKPLEAIVDRQYQTHESVHYYWNEDHWDMDKLFRTLPFNLVHKVASIPFDRGRPDKACWRLKASGEFSLKSARDQHIQILYHTRLLKHNHWKGDRNLADLLEYRFHKPQATTPILVRWLFPSLGWLKLNTDGAAKQILGLDIALEMGISRLWIKTDASAIISIINSTTRGHWKYQHLIMRIHDLLGKIEYKLTHIYREGMGLPIILQMRHVDCSNIGSSVVISKSMGNLKG
ncbi:UNVERIFIED_CONTAM: hypothetical protein Scaly_2659600 [Sesamum calycinum]|uniref:RNase H type-1 domain-containing protein n=1 Tax=Sesamum calycinum TaxID=2727403 RepID=A0AAW2J8Q0_9LAMI